MIPDMLTDAKNLALALFEFMLCAQLCLNANTAESLARLEATLKTGDAFARMRLRLRAASWNIVQSLLYLAIGAIGHWAGGAP